LKQYKWSTETYLEVEGETNFHFILACRLNEKGDKVTKVVNPENLFPVRITFESTAGEVPISGEILFRPIEGRPNVPRMATINVPSKEGVVEAEFLDYAKQL
jgi:hypothetical protein